MFYGLDVHKRFIQVCVVDDQGQTRREFRLAATPEGIDGVAAHVTAGGGELDLLPRA